MTKENITRFIKPCRKCGEPTAEFDGYCDTCFPPDKSVNPDGSDLTPWSHLSKAWEEGELST